jgi:hypothetical protein
MLSLFDSSGDRFIIHSLLQIRDCSGDRQTGFFSVISKVAKLVSDVGEAALELAGV